MKYIASILLIFLTGCDIFVTRTAEPPDQPRSNFQLSVTPELLIANFTSSYEEKNLQNYLSCFADTSFTTRKFLFTPSSGAASLYPSFADSWEKTDEEQYFNNLKSKVIENQSIIMVLNNANSLQQGDSIIYTASYSLSIPFQEESIPSNYQGELKFYLARDSRLVWSITYWQDIKTTQQPSWSDLKGRLY